MRRFDETANLLRDEAGSTASCIPCRPKFVRDLWVQALPDGLGVQVRGAGAPLLLRGPRAAPLVTFLERKLDGRHTLYEILADRPGGLTADQVLDALRLLLDRGVIASGDGSEAAPEDDPVRARQLLYWERHAGARSSGSAAAQERLHSRRLVLVGTGLFGATTLDLLRRSGARVEHVIAWDDPKILPGAAAHAPGRRVPCRALGTTSVADAGRAVAAALLTADLVVTATRNAPAALFEAINRSCLQAGVPWIRADEAGGTFDLGPTVVPHASACFHCAALREASVHPLAFEERWVQEALTRERPAGATPPLGECCAGASLGASLLVLEVVRVVTGLEAPLLRNAVIAVDPLRGESERHRLAPVPHCGECRPRRRTQGISDDARLACA